MNNQAINAEITAVTGVERPYCSCLNAMHEAEKVLTPAQGRIYHATLCEVMKCKTGKHPDGVKLISATAGERAEAFLKTLNLWEDAP